MAVSLGLILVPFYALNLGYLRLVSAATGYPPTRNSGGWSIFVGSNYDSWGRWNPEDRDISRGIFDDEELSTNEAHSILARKGIERWRELSLIQTVNLIIRKSVVLGGDQQHSIYNLSSYPSFWATKGAMMFVWLICAIYSLGLLFLAFLWSVREYRSKKHFLGFTHYVVLLFLGLFAAFLFVEVANRYFTPFFVFLTIFAAMTIERYLAKLAKLESR